MQVDKLFQTNTNELPDFGPGDTVKVNFIGVVIKRDNGNGPASNFTVRRIANGIGIERVFPYNSPLIDSLEVTRRGSVRRSSLYYLRGLQGSAARIKEKNTYTTQS